MVGWGWGGGGLKGRMDRLKLKKGQTTRKWMARVTPRLDMRLRNLKWKSPSSASLWAGAICGADSTAWRLTAAMP
jgi:hypothetical protein